MITEKEPKWAVNLSTELKSWIPINGYRASTELADELSIPRGVWNHIYQGTSIVAGGGRDNKFDGRFFYARINLWTELAASDPRNIPDKSIRLPRGGEVFKKRSLSEEDYHKWLEGPEAQALLAKRDERFKREVVMESAEPQPKEPRPTEQKSTQPETVGLFLGSLIDNIIERGAAQIADSLLVRQTEVIVPRISILDKRLSVLEEVIMKLVIKDTQQTPQGASRMTTTDIGRLAKRLSALLDGYKSGESQDRDKLMHTYGKDLMALDIVVHTLTRRPDERESILKLSDETKL